MPICSNVNACGIPLSTSNFLALRRSFSFSLSLGSGGHALSSASVGKAFSRSLQKHAGKVNIIMLGAGDKETEAALTKLNDMFPDNYKTYVGYNEELAHQIYAGSDFLLMPPESAGTCS